jgi:hypothetical protein
VLQWHLNGLNIKRRAWGSSGWSKKLASFNYSKCRHNRKCQWNGDMRSSMGPQNDGGWIKRQQGDDSPILHEDLRKRSFCAQFVPHRLTDEQKLQRPTSC